jgi:16S rRNA (uracil1498-N3)-methyltransferase
VPYTPHLYLPPPWTGESLALSPVQVKHLSKALRLEPGVAASYTDGKGVLGAGELLGQAVRRGQESSVDPPVDLEMAVAPPHERDRIRFLVEKAAELEVRRIRWLRAQFGNARPAQVARSSDWAVAALEQSRGAWLLAVDSDWVVPGDLDRERTTVVADRFGGPLVWQPPLTVVVGPEGGWAKGELPTHWPRLSLGRSTLRTETAVLAAAALVSSHSTNFAGD